MDDVDTLSLALDDARCALEGAEECGDLEDILELAMSVQDLEARLFRARMRETGSA